MVGCGALVRQQLEASKAAPNYFEGAYSAPLSCKKSVFSELCKQLRGLPRVGLVHQSHQNHYSARPKGAGRSANL
jgi:hypothetical protein